MVFLLLILFTLSICFELWYRLVLLYSLCNTIDILQDAFKQSSFLRNLVHVIADMFPCANHRPHRGCEGKGCLEASWRPYNGDKLGFCSISVESYSSRLACLLVIYKLSSPRNTAQPVLPVSWLRNSGLNLWKINWQTGNNLQDYATKRNFLLIQGISSYYAKNVNCSIFICA